MSTNDEASSEGASVRSSVPALIMILNVVYLVALAGLSLWWGQDSSLRSHFPSSETGVPVQVVWWGALGAVVSSTAAATKYRDTWDKSLNAWHVTRPVVGGVLGSIAYLIFVVVIDASGSVKVHGGGALLFGLVSFLVGYREQTFRELIKRATDVVFGSSSVSEHRPSVRHSVDES